MQLPINERTSIITKKPRIVFLKTSQFQKLSAYFKNIFTIFSIPSL